MVNGLPSGVVRGSDSRPSEAESLQTSEARVMRLKGYGNSIVVPLAAEFLKAVREVL